MSKHSARHDSRVMYGFAIVRDLIASDIVIAFTSWLRNATF